MLKRLGFGGGDAARPWLASLLALGVVLHLVQFPVIENHAADLTAAIWRYPSSDILSNGLPTDANSWSRYAYAVALAEIAPGSTVYYASDVSREHRRVLGFGKADEVVILDVPSAELLGELDPTPYMVATGLGGPRGAPWGIALEPGTGDYGDRDNPEQFLPDLLADGTRRVNDGGPPRVFFHVKWPVKRADDDSTYSYQHFLVEASLLDVDLEEVLP